VPVQVIAFIAWRIPNALFSIFQLVPAWLVEPNELHLEVGLRRTIWPQDIHVPVRLAIGIVSTAVAHAKAGRTKTRPTSGCVALPQNMNKQSGFSYANASNGLMGKFLAVGAPIHGKRLSTGSPVKLSAPELEVHAAPIISRCLGQTKSSVGCYTQESTS